ncbi:MAG: hypothetical protein LC670_10780 [Flavobacteriales bacterium]|nr:hypothetical protein [Flavobacteriales bacterium]
MTEDTNKLSRIEAFVEGTLPEKERAAVEKERLENPVLDAAIEEFELIRDGIVEAGKEELRQKIREWEAKERSGNHSRQSFTRIAAAILVILGCTAGLYTLLQNDGNSLENQALNMFSPYPSVISERGTAPVNAEDSIFMLYEEGRFEQITLMFENKRPEGDDMEGLRDFYLAESFIAEGRYFAAIDILSEFDDRNHALFEVARFHHALALILAGKTVEAEKKLEIIRSEKGLYREKAETLFRQIN